MSFYKIRPRAGTKAQWERANTVLGEREIGFEIPDDGVGSGQVRMKMGDGTTPWKNLKYAIVTESDITLTWTEWKSCGKNGCNVELWYRYCESAKLMEIRWDGTVNKTVTFNTMGFMWEGFPTDKAPKHNTFVPAQTQSNDLTIRFYPTTGDITANHWTIVSMHANANVSTAYVCGTFMYSYA